MRASRSDKSSGRRVGIAPGRGDEGNDRLATSANDCQARSYMTVCSDRSRRVMEFPEGFTCRKSGRHGVAVTPHYNGRESDRGKRQYDCHRDDSRAKVRDISCKAIAWGKRRRARTACGPTANAPFSALFSRP